MFYCSRTIFILAVVIISAIILIFAFYFYPVPEGDAFYFVAPGVHFARTGSLMNVLFIPEFVKNIIDPTGFSRFLQHPPLFPLVFGQIFHTTTAYKAFFILSAINIFVVVLSAWIFWKASTHIKKNWFWLIGTILALLVLATNVNTESGRPEILARFFAVMGIASFFIVSSKWLWLVFGIILGLIGATHPIEGLLAALFATFFFTANHKFPVSLLELLKTGALALFIFFLVIIIGPFSLKDTMNGMITHFQLRSDSVNQSLISLRIFLEHYVFSSVTPFFIGVLILLFILGIDLYQKKRFVILSPYLFWPASLLTLILFILIFIYTPGYIIYFTIFTPLFLVIILSWASEKGLFIKGLILCVFIFASAGFVREVVLFPLFLKQGPSFNETFSEIKSVLDDARGKNYKIAISSALWIFADDYEQVYIYNPDEGLKQKTGAAIFQQRYSGRTSPLELEGCILFHHTFRSGKPSVFGIQLANNVPGYGIAVYRCKVL